MFGDSGRSFRAAFVRRGSLSHSNASLLAALRRNRPDVEFMDVDINLILEQDRLLLARCALGVIGDYGLSGPVNAITLRYRLIRNSTAYKIYEKRIGSILRSMNIGFTIQTQSLWNAAMPGLPHFIYTDHVSLARDVVAWDHGTGSPSRAWLLCEARIYESASHVFTYGTNVRDILVERYGLPADRVSCAGTGPNVVPSRAPSVDIARFARRNILFAGGEWVRKGGPDLLAAFRRLRAILPDATLTIVGSRPPEAAGLPGVEAMDRVSKDRLEELYQTASCLCVPSRMEPFGNVFVEAAHFALPVVATRVGGIGDTVRDGVNGWRVAPGDPQQIADALHRVLSDPEKARAMGEAALRLSRDFTWDLVAERILAHAPVGSR